MTTCRQIRDAICTAVQGTTGLTVLRAPRYVVPESQLPCIALFSGKDSPQDPDEDCIGPHQRDYTVTLEIRVQGAPEDDATDALALQVRRAVLLDPDLKQLTNSISGPTQEWDGIEADRPEGATRLEFTVSYFSEPLS